MFDRDPIGVRDEPAAQDEYDAYAHAILDQLRAGVSHAALVDYLVDVEANRMGLMPDRGRAEDVATRLTALVDDRGQ